MRDRQIAHGGLERVDALRGARYQGGDVRHALVELGAGPHGCAGDAAERRRNAGERRARAAPVARLLLEPPQLSPRAAEIRAELSIRRLEANPKRPYLRVRHRLLIMWEMAELILIGPLIGLALSPFLAFLLFFIPAAIEGFKSLRD